jgi:hypothetical protein
VALGVRATTASPGDSGHALRDHEDDGYRKQQVVEVVVQPEEDPPDEPEDEDDEAEESQNADATEHGAPPAFARRVPLAKHMRGVARIYGEWRT